MLGAGVPRPLEIEIAAKLYRRAGGEALEVLRNLKFTVAAGAVTFLIGPSGCGKTTTLRILIGLDRDFEGQVWPAPGLLRLGVVFQEPRLLPWRSVEANVRLALPAARRGISLDELFADLALVEWRSCYPGELSTGLMRRVSLARALVVDPEFLVLDEPFVSLDERAADELRRFVFAAVTRLRTTVLMVTHNLREALQLADTLILLSPRPATVLAEIPLALPRHDRDQGWIERQYHDLTSAFPAVLA